MKKCCGCGKEIIRGQVICRECADMIDFHECPHCGIMIPGRDYIYCPYCGEKLRGDDNCD